MMKWLQLLKEHTKQDNFCFFPPDKLVHQFSLSAEIVCHTRLSPRLKEISFTAKTVVADKRSFVETVCVILLPADTPSMKQIHMNSLSRKPFLQTSLRRKQEIADSVSESQI